MLCLGYYLMSPKLIYYYIITGLAEGGSYDYIFCPFYFKVLFYLDFNLKFFLLPNEITLFQKKKKKHTMSHGKHISGYYFYSFRF